MFGVKTLRSGDTDHQLIQIAMGQRRLVRMNANHSCANQDQRSLRSLQRWALLLLLVMVVGFVVARLMGGHGVWEWVGAFCEAAAVGGCADWFAVVALFRHPMGLAIPHSAILAHNKVRLAEGIAHFVGDHFLQPTRLIHTLRKANPAQRLGDWLVDGGGTPQLARSVSGLGLALLTLLNRTAVRLALQRWIHAGLTRWNAAAMIADLAKLLTVDGHHQQILDSLLKRIGHWLDDDRIKAHASALIVRYARREWPTLVGTVNWIKPVGEIGDRLAERIARAGLDELQEILQTPDHRLRKHYERWVLRYIARMRHDPAVIARVNEWKQQVIDHPALHDYVASLWALLHRQLQRDLSQPGSWLLTRIAQGLAAIGQRLQTQGTLQHALNVALLRLAKRLSLQLRRPALRYITDTITRWDEAHLVNEIERSIGRDLQYIRFNGTLVGGCIGVGLHAVVRCLPQ